VHGKQITGLVETRKLSLRQTGELECQLMLASESILTTDTIALVCRSFTACRTRSVQIDHLPLCRNEFKHACTGSVTVCSFHVLYLQAQVTLLAANETIGLSCRLCSDQFVLTHPVLPVVSRTWYHTDCMQAKTIANTGWVGCPPRPSPPDAGPAAAGPLVPVDGGWVDRSGCTAGPYHCTAHRLCSRYAMSDLGNK
jgi:hypothetical protein